MSTLKTRNKMADKTYEKQFYFLANAQLVDNSEQMEVSPMSIAAINIAAAFHIFIRIIGHTNKTTVVLARDYR